MDEYIREHHRGSKGKNIKIDTHRAMVVKKGDTQPGFDLRARKLKDWLLERGVRKRNTRPKPTHDAAVRLESKSKLQVTKPRKSR